MNETFLSSDGQIWAVVEHEGDVDWSVWRKRMARDWEENRNSGWLYTPATFREATYHLTVIVRHGTLASWSKEKLPIYYHGKDEVLNVPIVAKVLSMRIL